MIFEATKSTCMNRINQIFFNGIKLDDCLFPPLQNWRPGQPNPQGNLATCLYTEANGIPTDIDGNFRDHHKA